MNVKKSFLFVSLLLMANFAIAGTITIKSPPFGLKLNTTSGTLGHGDKDLVLVGASVTSEVISPDTGSSIVGFITLSHSEGVEWLYGNVVSCELTGPYTLSVEFVGFKKFDCKGGDGTVQFAQRRSEGASDVILTFADAKASE